MANEGSFCTCIPVFSTLSCAISIPGTVSTSARQTELRRCWSIHSHVQPTAMTSPRRLLATALPLVALATALLTGLACVQHNLQDARVERKGAFQIAQVDVPLAPPSEVMPSSSALAQLSVAQAGPSIIAPKKPTTALVDSVFARKSVEPSAGVISAPDMFVSPLSDAPNQDLTNPSPAVELLSLPSASDVDALSAALTSSTLRFAKTEFAVDPAALEAPHFTAYRVGARCVDGWLTESAADDACKFHQGVAAWIWDYE